MIDERGGDWNNGIGRRRGDKACDVYFQRYFQHVQPGSAQRTSTRIRLGVPSIRFDMSSNLVRWPRTFQNDNQCNFGEVVRSIFYECEAEDDESDMAVTDMTWREHFPWS